MGACSRSTRCRWGWTEPRRSSWLGVHHGLVQCGEFLNLGFSSEEDTYRLERGFGTLAPAFFSLVRPISITTPESPTPRPPSISAN